MSGKLNDGHQTKVRFSLNASVKLYEKEVTPPGVQGGGAIDTTTMRNTTWRTQAPKSLKKLSDGSFTAAYDPAVYTQILAMVNQNQTIYVDFPDGVTLSFWGWIDEFNPERLSEGSQPTAEVKIIPSMQNNSGAETAPNIS